MNREKAEGLKGSAASNWREIHRRTVQIPDKCGGKHPTRWWLFVLGGSHQGIEPQYDHFKKSRGRSLPAECKFAMIPIMDTPSEETTEVSQVNIELLDFTPMKNAGSLLALADVALMLDGVEIIIHGVQVRADFRNTRISLPKFRASSGEWKPAITLPEEVRYPMADIIIAAGIEAGILQPRDVEKSEV
ncbi:hypothetical protein [Magnetospirillum sp. XM-1]|uniref:hypothetical protein n=1 Tax=Magnetospirillum sp. XM-1 TaxID=1663591 RepID=UPI001E3874D1|nr:hypothetical protein [Magnetospirillum sp. XM-1]